MAIKDLDKIDEKLSKMYENQTTTNAVTEPADFVDRSELLLSQMTFIAINNQSFVNFKK